MNVSTFQSIKHRRVSYIHLLYILRYALAFLLIQNRAFKYNKNTGITHTLDVCKYNAFV
jgi:hypothetical protein